MKATPQNVKKITAICCDLKALRHKEDENIEKRLEVVGETLIEIARDPDHAAAIVAACLRNYEWLPVPSQVETQAEALRAAASQPWQPNANPRTLAHVRSDIGFWSDLETRLSSGRSSAGGFTVAECHKNLARLRLELESAA